MPQPIHNIAVWNTAFLGDAVLTLPLIRTLTLAFPGSRVDFYVRRGLSPLFAGHPALHAVYEYDKKSDTSRKAGSLLEFGRILATRQYDLWIGAHPSIRSAILARLSRAPIRVGYREGGLRFLFYTHCVSRHFGELHEIERLLELIKPVLPPDFNLDNPDCHWPELVLPETVRQEAEGFRHDLRLQGKRPLLGLHPGSVWGTKRWTPSGFAEIARRAASRGAHVLVFAGGGAEEAMAAEVIQLAGLHGNPLLHDLSGKLSLPELAAYLAILDCYVSNDSGPMHLAWAQRTPVTALFGPTVEKWGFFPRGKDAHVFQVDLPCRPCGLHGPQVCPRGHHHCMTQISVEEVWKDVESRLFGSQTVRC